MGLTNGTNYTIAVRAVNGAASTLNRTPVIPALASLRATPGYRRVTLSWRDRDDSRIAKYQFSSDGGASYTSVAFDSTDLIPYVENNLNRMKYTITGLTNDTLYTFKVRTANADDTVIGAEAPPETKDPLTATPLFTAPSNLTAAPADGQVTLSWDDPNTTEISKYQLKIDGGAFADIPSSGATTTEHTVTGLTNYTSYTFTVRAYDSNVAGPSAAVIAYPVAGPTAAPDNLQATPADGQVTLNWDDPGNAAITDYDVSSDGGINYTRVASDSTDLTYTSEDNTIEYTITGLTNWTRYSFAVRAVNVSGAGAPSKTVSTEPGVVPGDVGNLTATPKHERVKLSWVDPTSHLRTGGYRVRYKKTNDNAWGEWQTLLNWVGNTNELTIYKLTNSESHDFEVWAYNYIGDGPTSELAATPVPEVPTKPTGLSAVPGDGEVTLTWDDPPDDEKSSIVEYKVSVDGFDNYVRIDDKYRSYTYAYLTNGTKYSFEVRANNSAGDSLSSGAKEATPLLPAPRGLQASPGGGQVTLSWDNPNNAAITGYEVSSDGGTNYSGITGSGADTTEHTVTGLDGGTEKTFAVRAVNGVAATVSATPLFAAPADLTALVGDQQITLDWTAPVPGNSAISGYEMSSDNGANYTPISGSGATTTSHIVQNLSNGTEYTFAVRAANGAAAMVNATPMFAAPTSLTATPGYGEVTLTWDDPGNPAISGYEVSSDGWGSYSTISDSDSDDDTISHTVTGLTGGTLYSLAVRAVGSSLTGAAATVNATPMFAAPTGLTATAGDGQVTLNWDDPGNSNITGYKLSINAGAFAEIGGSDAATTSHTVTGLTNGTTYTFAVRAVNASGEGASSDTVTATPLFAAPTNLSAETGDAQVKLSWTDPGNTNISGYEVSTDRATNYSAISDGDSEPTTISHTVTSLTNGTTYTFAVRAVNGAPATVTATPVGQDPPPTPPPVPGRPGNLTAAPDDRAIALSWTAAEDNGSPIIKYQHRRSGVGWEDVPGGPTATEVTVSGLTNGVEYAFYVRAVSSAGTGAQASVSATPAAAPDAPGNLTAAPDDGAVALSWTAAEDNGSPIIKYQHRRSGVEWEDVPGGPTATEVTVSGLTNGVEYVFHLRAVSSAVTGAQASVSATPAAAPEAPGNLTTTPDDGAVALSWTAAEDNGSPIIKYQHQRDDAPWADVAGGATANSLTVTGLVNDTQYTFSVRAVNGMGEGAVASVTAAPQADLADPEPGETPVPTPEPTPTPTATPEPTPTPTATPEPTRQVVLPTSAPTRQVVLPTSAPTRQVVLPTSTLEPQKAEALATVTPLTAIGPVVVTPTAARMVGPTPLPTATPTPGLTATVVPRGTLEPTVRPIATPAETPLEEALVLVP